MSKKIQINTPEQVVSYFANNIANKDPLLLLMINCDDNVSKIRMSIREDEELISGILEYAKSGYLTDVVDFIVRSRHILDIVEDEIKAMSKLN